MKHQLPWSERSAGGQWPVLIELTIAGLLATITIEGRCSMGKMIAEISQDPHATNQKSDISQDATCSIPLSERDAADVLSAAENPPAPNEAALTAARRFSQTYG